MNITIPLQRGLSLSMNDGRATGNGYATSALQKGWLLCDNGRCLAEEAVGFGVPVVKRGIRALFPGAVEMSLTRDKSVWRVAARFTLNLEEKICRPGRGIVGNGFVYGIKNSLAAAIRTIPLSRAALTAASSAVRLVFGLQTVYECAEKSDNVAIMYTVDAEAGTLLVEADTSGITGRGVSEFVLMNEQGAHFFQRYIDSSGLSLGGKKIGCWDEVEAGEASFGGSVTHASFTAEKAQGGRLFRGRELVGSRLAWSGFGYSFPSLGQTVRYTLRITRDM
jgi:hypothetical protein